MLIWKPIHTMCEKPVQWTANSNVFTRVLEVKEWFVFNTCQNWVVFYFNLKFSFENIFNDRSPMQHMDGVG